VRVLSLPIIYLISYHTYFTRHIVHEKLFFLVSRSLRILFDVRSYVSFISLLSFLSSLTSLSS
jgi:hypothetical protein